MTLYRNKYRIESARLPGWNYAAAGYYFITINTHERAHLFGKVVRGEMVCNPLGLVVWEEWERSAEIRRELELDAFVVMPDHIHAIVVIKPGDGTEAQDPPPAPPTGKLYRRPKSVSSFVAGFKSACTTRINQIRRMPGVPVWQPRFYDHIIRNEAALERIRRYIINNPAQWDSKYGKRE